MQGVAKITERGVRRETPADAVGGAMRLSPTPDLGSTRRLVATAAVVTLAVWVFLILSKGAIGRSLGDTDDAMRLVLVRDLLAGRGWYDQLIPRLTPPTGAYL